jgi:methionyl-tRNA formyltransferase
MIKILSGTVVDAAGEPGTVVSTSKDGIVVAAGNGSFCITALQPEGRKRMAAHEFLTGHPLGKGQVFTR